MRRQVVPAQIDLGRQLDVRQIVLTRDTLVLEGTVDVPGFEQRQQLDAGAAHGDWGVRLWFEQLGNVRDSDLTPWLGRDWRLETAHRHVFEEEGVIVDVLGQDEGHEGPVACGIEAWVGQPEAHAGLADKLRPVRRVDAAVQLA